MWGVKIFRCLHQSSVAALKLTWPLTECHDPKAEHPCHWAGTLGLRTSGSKFSARWLGARFELVALTTAGSTSRPQCGECALPPRAPTCVPPLHRHRRALVTGLVTRGRAGTAHEERRGVTVLLQMIAAHLARSWADHGLPVPQRALACRSRAQHCERMAVGPRASDRRTWPSLC